MECRADGSELTKIVAIERGIGCRKLTLLYLLPVITNLDFAKLNEGIVDKYRFEFIEAQEIELKFVRIPAE